MISNTELERFYAEKGMRSACPTCGQTAWSLAEGPDPQTDWALSSVRTDGSAFLPAPSVPVLVLICSNCYTLRQHALLGVQSWLKANPAKE